MTDTQPSRLSTIPAPHRKSPAPADGSSGGNAYETTLADLASVLAGTAAAVRPRTITNSVRRREGGGPEAEVSETDLDSRLMENDQGSNQGTDAGRPCESRDPEPFAHTRDALDFRLRGNDRSVGSTGDTPADIAVALHDAATRIRALDPISADDWPALYCAAIDVLNAAEFARTEPKIHDTHLS